MITGRFTMSRKARHPGGGQRITVYSSTSLCLLHKAQNHRPVSPLELSIADRLFDKGKPSTVWSGVTLPRNQAHTWILMGIPWVPILSSAQKNDTHGPYLPSSASFQSNISREESVTEGQGGASFPVSLSFEGSCGFPWTLWSNSPYSQVK